MAEKEKLRLDKYLWAIRLFKTRTQAAAACDTGKVKFNGQQAKAARHVNIDEEYEVKTEAKRWRIRVTGLLHNRVAYAEAINYYTDITPLKKLKDSNTRPPVFILVKDKARSAGQLKNKEEILMNF